jgi:hypothetical protein
MRTNRLALIIATGSLLSLGLLSGCGGRERPKADLAASQVTTIGVNSYLWRASLETLSFLPIKTADNVGGVIATDWYADPAKPSERVRANVLILGKKLQASALQVTLFKQTEGKGGVWNDTPADPASARALEDTILTKARALRVRDQATQ